MVNTFIHLRTHTNYSLSEGMLTSEYIANFWDSIENCFYIWLENVLNGLGPSKVIMRDGTINITRTKEASNDRLFMCQFEFNLSTYRKCLTLV